MNSTCKNQSIQQQPSQKGQTMVLTPDSDKPGFSKTADETCLHLIFQLFPNRPKYILIMLKVTVAQRDKKAEQSKIIHIVY